VGCEPDSSLLPVHAPDALHAVTFRVDHVNVVVPPGATPGGDAVNVADGDVAEEMETVACAIAAPPGPLQLSLYVVVLPIAPVDVVPLVALPPLQPPEAVHLSALLDDHVNIDDPPDDTDPGFAAIVTVGGLCEPSPCAVELPPDPLPPQPASIIDEITASSRAAVCIDVHRRNFIRSLLQSVPCWYAPGYA
jgi:hypothetical protein